MRAWFVNEKFTEDSDPVGDMQIGMSRYVEQIKKEILEKEKRQWYNTRGIPPKEAARLTSPNNVAKYAARNYFHYGVDIALGVINYYLTQKQINQTRTYLIHSALNRGRSIKNRHKFIQGLVSIGIKVKSVDIEFSMGTKDDEMTRFLVESAIQQRRPKVLKRLMDAALKHAIKHKKVDMILWLFEKGADPSYNKYETLRWALENDHKELVKVVLKHINNNPEYQ